MIVRFANRFVLSAIVAACFLFMSVPGFAQPVAGCNPQVLDAMHKKAQSKVAVDVAMTETITDKPDSVLAMTCFNNSSGTSANHGGSIFSGDFTSGLQPIIEDALKAFYDDFMDGAGFEAMVAGLPTAVDYGQTALANTQDCNEVKDLWQTIKDQGIQKGVPFATLTNLISGALPGGLLPGDEYNDNWIRDQGDNLFADLAASIAALPVPNTTPAVLNDNMCDAMRRVGAMPGAVGSPCPF